MANGLLGLNDPQTIGLLSAGLGMLSQANGPNSHNAIPQGLLAGVGAFQNATESQANTQYRHAQAENALQQAALTQGRVAAINRVNARRGFLGSATPPQAGGLLGLASPQSGGGLLGGPTAGGSAASVPAHANPSGFPFTIEDVMDYKIAGIDIFDQYKYATDGVKREAGASYVNPITGQTTYTPKVAEGQEVVYTPNGPQVRPLAGYSEANARVAGDQAAAIAGANVQFDLAVVPDGNGDTKMMPRSQAALMLGGGMQGGLGTVQNPKIVEAQSALPKIERQIDSMIGTIDQELANSGKDWSWGRVRIYHP